MSDFSSVFKILNLAIGGLSTVSGITQLLSGFQALSLGLYQILFGIGIVLLEFKIPPLTHQYASFLFSFLGRGVFYLLIGALIAHDSSIRFIVGFLVDLIGIGYIVLEFLPNIEPPENFRTDGHILDDDGEDDII